jgi:hypothetical protein
MQSISARLRLSDAHARLILPALRLIVAADSEWQVNHSLVRAGRDFRFYETCLGTTNYDAAGMKPFYETLEKLSKLASSGGRVRFTCYELAACVVAARHVRVSIRHGHLKGWLKDHDVATDCLIGKLERYRRRARRLYEKHLGVEAYREVANVWADTLAWVHTFYLWCPCNKRPRSSFLRAWYRGVVDRCVTLAAEGLLRRCSYPPPEGQLRQMVRKALRSARRNPSGMPPKLIVERPRQGGDYLAEVILRTNGKTLRRFDLSTTQSDRAQRLRSIPE